MIIKTKIEFNEYLKLMFFLTYRKGWYIFLSVIGVVFFVNSTLSFTEIFKVNSTIDNDNTLSEFVFGILIVFLLPFLMYLRFKSTYFSNARIQEPIVYEFLNDQMKITGESFNSEADWSKTNKIEETRKWFLIYESKLSAHLIPKRNLSQEQIIDLRKILEALKDVRVKLKK